MIYHRKKHTTTRQIHLVNLTDCYRVSNNIWIIVDCIVKLVYALILRNYIDTLISYYLQRFSRNSSQTGRKHIFRGCVCVFAHAHFYGHLQDSPEPFQQMWPKGNFPNFSAHIFFTLNCHVLNETKSKPFSLLCFIYDVIIESDLKNPCNLNQF